MVNRERQLLEEIRLSKNNKKRRKASKMRLKITIKRGRGVKLKNNGAETQ